MINESCHHHLTVLGDSKADARRGNVEPPWACPPAVHVELRAVRHRGSFICFTFALGVWVESMRLPSEGVQLLGSTAGFVT